MHREKYAPNSTIIEESTVGDCAYFIEEGLVEVSVRRQERKIVLAVLGPGDIFGEVALIAESVRTASVIALSTTIVSRITKEYYREMIAQADPIVSMLLRVLLDRFHETRSKLLIFPAVDLKSLSLENSRSIPYRQEDRHNDAIERVKFINDLQSALHDNRFEIYYQPIINLHTFAIAGFEALLRWFHPTRGEISPTVFIPIAEGTKMIIPLGSWVFQKACEALKAFREIAGANEDSQEPWMSINVSAVQFCDEQLVSGFEKTLQKLNLAPSSVTVELTERILAENVEPTLSFLQKVKQLGMKVAVDDFGTGYSSLSYLHLFPVDYIKIDRSFVKAMLKDPRCLKIIQGLVAMSDDLNIDLVGEGVDCSEEITLLKQLGCEYAQGYYFEKPTSFDKALALLHSNP